MSKDMRENTITGRELIDVNAPYRVMSRLVVSGGSTLEDLEGTAFWSLDDARRERDKRRAGGADAWVTETRSGNRIE
jgi:hypothetical protein